MSNFRRSNLVDRYENDPTFNRVVGAIYNLIAQHGITPCEIREAAFMAHYKYEMENPRAMQHSVVARMSAVYDHNITNS